MLKTTPTNTDKTPAKYNNDKIYYALIKAVKKAIKGVKKARQKRQGRKNGRHFKGVNYFVFNLLAIIKNPVGIKAIL